MGALIRLKNNTPSPFVGTLLHDSYCRYGGKCECRQEKYMSPARSKETGEVGFRAAMRSVHKGFSIPPWVASEPFHRAILKVPGVAEAVSAGLLTPVPVPDKPPKVPIRAAPPPPMPSADEGVSISKPSRGKGKTE